jgi:hypothetical protein
LRYPEQIALLLHVERRVDDHRHRPREPAQNRDRWCTTISHCAQEKTMSSNTKRNETIEM